MAKKLTSTKAKKILHDKEVHGHPLTEQQRKFFGAIAGGAEPYKAQIGTLITGTSDLISPVYNIFSKIRNLGTSDYSDKKDFDAAYSAAKKAGEEEFVWNGKRYNTKYAGTPRQEVGTYGVQGKPVELTSLRSDPSRVNLYPMFGKYLPGHLEASVTDEDGVIGINYSSAGNKPWIDYIKPEKGEKAYYVYGADKQKFSEKAISLPLGIYSYVYDGADNRPSDWELFTNNCADNVCDAFGIPRSRGLQTPKGTIEKIKKAYPTLDVTGRTRDDYDKFVEQSKKSSLNKEKSKDVLSSADKLLNIYYSPDTPSSSKKDIGYALQRSLLNQGYKLPKSHTKLSELDQIVGDETLGAIKDWKSKNKKQNGGAIEGTMGGLTDKGFNYNGAWGGPSMQMGGVLPGAVGFTYARTAGAAPANGPYAKKTKASAQDGTEQSLTKPSVDWFKQWYEQRKTLPQFSRVAEKRLGMLSTPPKVELTPIEDLQKFGAVAEYKKVRSADPSQDILSLADPATIPAYAERLQKERGKPFLRPVDPNLGTHSSVVGHEMSHWLDARAPQHTMLPRGVNRSEPFERYPIFDAAKFKETGLDLPTYRWISNSRLTPVPGVRTEFNSVLNELRQREGLRGDQPTTPEQMKGIMDKYMNLSEDQLFNQTTEGSQNDRIRTLIKYLGKDPAKLSELNNRIVAAPKKQTPIAQNGAKIPVIEDAGSFNKEGVWIPDWEKMTAQAKKLGAKKVKTKHGSVIYFNDKWEVSSVDDNPGAKAQNGQEMKFYQEGLDFTPKTISKNGGWLDKYDSEVPKAQDGLTEKEKADVIKWMQTGKKSTPATQKTKPSTVTAQPSRVFTQGPPLSEALQKRITAETLKRQTQKSKPLTATNTREQAVEKGRAENLRVVRENKEAEEQAIAEGRAAEATRENPNVPFTFPTGETKLWKDMDWREQQYISGKNLGSMSRSNNWTDWINPITMIGEMGEGLATAPYMARETDSNLPYVAGIVSPLLGGALGGSGTKSVGQFANNMMNPLAGISLSSAARPVQGAARQAETSLVDKLLLRFPTKGLKINDNYQFTVDDRIATGLESFSKGLNYGLTEIAFNPLLKLKGKPTRPLGEIFPTTELQKYEAGLRGQAALDKGVQFVKDWTYDKSGWVRPEIARKINAITSSGASPSPYAAFLDNYTQLDQNNPLSSTRNISTRTRFKNVINNPNLNVVDKIRILSNRGGALGLNTADQMYPASYTFQNMGPYGYSYPEQLETAVHETGHTMQELGFPGEKTYEGYGFGKAMAYYDPEFGYDVPNTATEIGRKFAEVMPAPRKGKNNWKSSPLELHAELMPARKKLVNQYVKSGKTYEEALETVRNASDEDLDWMIKKQNLNRFFKKDITPEQKRSMLRILPATVPAVGAASALGGESEQPPKQQYGGDIPVDPMGYWNPDNVGSPVIIPSTDITMEGVDQPLVGISDTGDVQYMEPGEDYEFEGDYVTEYPVAKKGVSVNKADQNPKQKLDQLLNFTNYNKPTKGGWLDKYN